MRSGHYNLGESLYKIKVVNTPICVCGYECENLNHTIWQCNSYNDQRKELIKSMVKLFNTLPLNIEMLIAKPNVVACSLILSFLEKCNLMI